MSLSVLIIVYNDAENLRGALDSVRFADEVVVVDNGSTDGSGAVAESMGAKVVRLNENKGYVEAKRIGLRHCANEWVLWLDSDERVTPELADEIKKALLRKDFVAFKFPRKSFFLGRWIRHCGWYPDYVVRLFRKECARFSDDLVHERLVVDGPIGKLSAPILHYTDPNLEHYLTKFNRYTTLAAKQMLAQGRKPTLFDLLLRPPATFIRMYVLKLGFLDGLEGFLLCALSAMYVLVKYSKAWFSLREADLEGAR